MNTHSPTTLQSDPHGVFNPKGDVHLVASRLGTVAKASEQQFGDLGFKVQVVGFLTYWGDPSKNWVAAKELP